MFMAQIRDYPEIKMIKDTNATRNLEMLEDKINDFCTVVYSPCHAHTSSWRAGLMSCLNNFRYSNASPDDFFNSTK
ncbi:hypothetical protein Hdeb2414_s0036g00731251 [Helianthus debilis subsp. tardiflorus]